MSIVVKCDKCGKEIGNDENRVVLQATLYTLFDPEADQQPAVSASAPAGTPTPAQTGPLGPMNVSGSTAQFMQQPAFTGELEMHQDCWDKWLNPTTEEKKTTRKRS